MFVAGAGVAGLLAASNPAALLADTTGLLTDSSTSTAQTCTQTDPTATTTTADCPTTSTDPTTTETTTTETTPTITTPPETVSTTPPETATSPALQPTTNAAPVVATPPTTTTQGNSSKSTGSRPAAHAKSHTILSATVTLAETRREASKKAAARARKRAAAAKAKAKAKAASEPKVEVPYGLTVQLPAPPKYLIRTYRRAGRRYDVPWKILAAINGIETGYGANLNVSSAGAMGWMQFLPSTWQIYGRGGNPYDPHDSIYAAARLLHDAGASTDLPAAIYAYNHADWYVAAVLWQAANMDSRGRTLNSTHGYALPLDARYMAPLGRTDDGVDIENAPDGAPVYSMTPGIVTAVASNPGGFGPNYPVILVTDGPLAGRYIYYGHVAASLVQQGQTVTAGEPIAIMGHTGDAADLNHGHIEIGFSDGSGTPLEQHGLEAWTASGQAMRGVMEALAKDAGVKLNDLKQLKLSRPTLLKLSQLQLH